jgi:hypothetical protein
MLSAVPVQADARVVPSCPSPAPLHELAILTLRRGNALRLRARGGSMLPFLRDGDVLEVRPAGAGEVAAGDVACYESPAGGLCLHRIVARDARGLLARGDALAAVERVPATALLGLVTAVERRGRRWRLGTRAARRRGRLIARIAPVVARLLPLGRALHRAARAIRRRA